MNILFVLEKFELGGVERVTFQLLSSIKSSFPAIQFSVIYESNEGEFFQQYNESFDCIKLLGINFIKKTLSFKLILNRMSPDLVVYCKGGLSKYKPLIATDKSIQHIAIQHVPIDLPDTSWFKNSVRRFGAALLYRRMDKIICVSNGIENNLVKKIFLNQNKLLTIYNPVLDDGILNLSRESVEYSDYYVCVGRLHYQKGYDYLLKIVALVVKKKPALKVVIIGDGEEKELLAQQIINSNLSDNVILHGSTSNPYKYIKNAKAILLPSRWEGLPTVLVEAAFLETQIISFDCRYGPKELTCRGKNGYLVDMGDTASFVQCILQVDDGKLKPHANIDDFTLASSTNNYLTLFESLICKIT
jgi:glycosyltransferase involved in cell wall biosynthesis